MKRYWWIEGNSYWPRDSRGWIFLARAVYRIGKAKFASEWTGEEPLTWDNSHSADLRPLPPLPNDATSNQLVYADKVLREQRPDLATTRRPMPFPSQITFTPEEWRIAWDEVERLREPRRQIFRRFEAITRIIATEAEAGRLVTGLRPTDGGVVRAIPAVFWNTEKLSPRFTMCQMNSADPFSRAFAGEGFGWIFVCAEGLARFIKTLKSRPVSSNQARKRARQYLEPIMTKAKAANMTRDGLIAQCAATQAVGVSAAREAYESLLPNAEKSWRKMGRPRKLTD